MVSQKPNIEDRYVIQFFKIFYDWFTGRLDSNTLLCDLVKRTSFKLTTSYFCPSVHVWDSYVNLHAIPCPSVPKLLTYNLAQTSVICGAFLTGRYAFWMKWFHVYLVSKSYFFYLIICLGTSCVYNLYDNVQSLKS